MGIDAPTTPAERRDCITAGRAALGIELGSTTIKASLVAPDGTPLASGRALWENEYRDGVWTYSLEAVRDGLRDCYAGLRRDCRTRYDVVPEQLAGLGVSAMMHGYLALDGDGELLIPFRTWRNTSTGRAAAELSERLECHIPLRWSVAHLYQAVLDDEPHVARIASLTTLAGWVHRTLTGRHVLGIGDASGMFPVDGAARDYDRERLRAFDELVAGSSLRVPLLDALPQVLVAGQDAGTLTQAGARLLDPSGTLVAGVPLCPPEGDAGTGMVATDSIAPGTANVSVGTSVFAMVVLPGPLSSLHDSIDTVSTPDGHDVAMVHCNNGASELQAWSVVFGQFARAIGAPLSDDEVFDILLTQALTADADAGGVLVHPFLAGEPVAGVADGRPLVVRPPDGRLTLPNFARALADAVFASLAMGMRALQDEEVRIDRLFAHGGLFRTGRPAQRLLAAALDVPVALGVTPGEGGAWGIALLASYRVNGRGRPLPEFLRDDVFASVALDVVSPDARDVEELDDYVRRFEAALPMQRTASAQVR